LLLTNQTYQSAVETGRRAWPKKYQD